MTRDEAGALAARLTRIWHPATFTTRYVPGPVIGRFYYSAHFPDKVRLVVDNDDDELNFDLHKGRIFLMAKPSLGVIDTFSLWEEDDDKEAYYSFVAQWMPVFRRGCWLSGCPVKASTRKKAEWAQGFSREEIDAWKLKF